MRSGIADNNGVAVEGHQDVEVERVMKVQHAELVLRPTVSEWCDATCLGSHLGER
ncbi:MAG: hypothetical protein ACRDMH_10410 [Solirubrobacterales bacterium]